MTDYLYGVKCTDENDWIYIDTDIEPTLCPNDPSHTITNVVKIRQTKKILTVDDNAKGRYKTETLEFDIPSGSPGDIHLNTKTFLTDTLVWTVQINVTTDMIGDYLDIIVLYDQPIGIVTAPVNGGSTLIPVNSTVTNVIEYGFEVVLLDTSQSPPVTQILGECIEIDKETGTITVETPTSEAFAPGSIIKVNLFMVHKRRFCLTGIMEFSKKGLKAKPVHANWPIVLRYHNMDGAAKKLCVDLERFYGFKLPADVS